MMTREEEIKMFGMTIEEMESMAESVLSVRMLPLSIMSNCQELLEIDDDQSKESIRQSLNVAKYISDKYLVAK